jgi:hypothetical protein
MGVDDLLNGIYQCLTVFFGLVISEAVVFGFEVVEGDVGRVSDLFILQPAVGIGFVTGFAVFFLMLPQLAVGDSRAVGDRVKTGKTGVFVEDRVEVVKVIIDDGF